MEMDSAMKRNGHIINPLLTTMKTRGHFKPKMGWSDRERVLRIVFSKINSGEMPLYWREIDVDDLRNELTRDDDGNHAMTIKNMTDKLRMNIQKEKEIQQKLAVEMIDRENGQDYAVEELSEEFERDFGDSQLSSQMMYQAKSIDRELSPGS